MIGFRLRRLLWILALLGGVGLALHYAVAQLAEMPLSRLEHAAGALAQGREWLAWHGPWVHLAVHGAMYLYLLWCWPQMLRWVDRRRTMRGHAPLAAVERRRLAVTLAASIAVYEGLLLLRHWG